MGVNSISKFQLALKIDLKKLTPDRLAAGFRNLFSLFQFKR